MIIRVGIVPPRVIGVLETKGQSAGGQDQDDTVFVPFTASRLDPIAALRFE